MFHTETNRRALRIGWAAAIALAALGSPAASGKAAERSDPAAGIEFFEKEIRPLLVEHCYDCHSADSGKSKGGLRLDTRQGWARGGDSGPALVPGNPGESLLIEAVRYDNPDLEMPPKQKLSAREIGLLEKWVALSAPDPRNAESDESDPSAHADAPAFDLETAREFWSYRQPVKHPVPPVTNAAWPRNEIDRFLLARMEESGAVPVADADRATFARRLYFDMIGLPPTPGQLDEFLRDPSPDAVGALVDRLLASPRFGERWGRHWLDVARFAESVTLRGLVFKQAWRYRDFVVDAFNRDLPYNEFVREQIAGDLLPSETLEEKQRRLVATGFLVLGNINLEEQDKKQLDMNVVDEQLDVIGKTILAQTITCARCHDHKFDPIPTRDYYALAGILRGATSMVHNNVSGWVERPLPLDPEQERRYSERDRRLAGLRGKLAAAEKRAKALNGDAGGAQGDGFTPVEQLPGIVLDDRDQGPDSETVRIIGSWTRSQSVRPSVGSGYLHDGDDGKGAKSIIFRPDLDRDGIYEVRIAYTAGSNRATNAPITVRHADGAEVVTVNQRVKPPIDGHFVSIGRYRFDKGSTGSITISNQDTDGHVIADAVQLLPEASLAASGRTDRDAAEDDGEREREIARQLAEAKEEAARLKAEIAAARAELPDRPVAMSLKETEPTDLSVHIRGSVHNLGEPVPRGFLQVAHHGGDVRMPSSQSGRRELAEWLSSETNPLTARVMVNRVWHWMFGSGLVRTPDNFGKTGERPSHPRLLDWLTVRFMEEGWSVKWLIREISLTRAYQLSTEFDASNATADPDNRLVWRMHRKRLEAECIRDAMLHIAGNLRLTAGGATFPASINADYGFEFDQPVRSLYIPVFRNALPELFEVFDFADPSLVTGKRNVSTVAPQALFLLNHPFPREQAAAAARRFLTESGAEPGTEADEIRRIETVYRSVLGRKPSGLELSIARAQLGAGTDLDPAETEKRWAELIQALFASIDFRYLN